MLFKNLFNKGGDQLAREAMDDYKKNVDEFLVIQKLQKALKLGIENYPLDQIYLHIGSCYFDVSIFDKAIEAYEKAYSINPTNSSVISNLGLSYKSIGHSEKALQLYFDALKSKPDNSYALHNIGYYYYEIGDHFQAIDYLDKAIKINTSLAVAYAIKARCMAYLGLYKDAKLYARDAKNRGYENMEGLENNLLEIKEENPIVYWNLEKFVQLAELASQGDTELSLLIRYAAEAPYKFYREYAEKFEDKNFSSFDIFNILPFILLFDHLSEKKQLAVIGEDDHGFDIICELENVVREKYEIETDFFEEFKIDYEASEAEEIVTAIASKLKLKAGIELIDFWYSDSQLLVTPLLAKEWEILKYPYTAALGGYGRIRNLASKEAIEAYLMRE